MLLIAVVFIFTSCETIDKDVEKPIVQEVFFPQNCDTVHRGSTFTYSFVIVDDKDLGSYSIEMHNNFDHHTHSTSTISCTMEENKLPINPFYYNEDFEVPVKLWEYKIEGEITIPANVDSGDYHFELRVSDEAGWQTYEGISIKVL